MRRSVGLAWRTAVWAVLLVLIGVLLAAVLVPRVAGATPYTVLTGSMEPGLPPGTLVVVRPVPLGEIGLGTVITYQLESGRSTVVTHRVVGTGVSTTGERVLTTKGDANATPDGRTVRPVQVRGEVWYAVPHLGRVSNVITADQRGLASTAVVVGLAFYATTMFITAGRDKRRRQHPTKEDSP